MTQLMIAIALWCGQPTAGPLGVTQSQEVVAKCRTDMLKCQNGSADAILKCFK